MIIKEIEKKNGVKKIYVDEDDGSRYTKYSVLWWFSLTAPKVSSKYVNDL